MKNYKDVYLLAAVLVSAGVAIHQVSAAQAPTTASASAATPGSAQTPVTGQTNSNSSGGARLDNGTALVAELTRSLNAGHARPGDTVKARVTQDVIAHGKIVVRRDSKLIGHVTEAIASSKDAPGSRLGVVFDKAVLKGGGEVEFSGLIEAMAAPIREPSHLNEPDQMMAPSMGVGNSAGLQPMGSSGPGSTRTNQTTTSTNSPGTNSANGLGRRTVPNLPNTPAPAVGPGGALSSGAHGVIGIPGLRLMHGPSGGSNAAVVTSVKDNVKLETGTQVVIQVGGTP